MNDEEKKYIRNLDQQSSDGDVLGLTAVYYVASVAVVVIVYLHYCHPGWKDWVGVVLVILWARRILLAAYRMTGFANRSRREAGKLRYKELRNEED